MRSNNVVARIMPSKILFSPTVNEFCLTVLFFFSSRRRHTRSKRDWSSDVCSSDLFLQFKPGGLGELVSAQRAEATGLELQKLAALSTLASSSTQETRTYFVTDAQGSPDRKSVV